MISEQEGTAWAVIDFPSPWPPDREIAIWQWRSGEAESSIAANREGRLILRLRAGEFTTPRLEAPVRAALVLRWNGDWVSLHINGAEVPLNDPQSAPLAVGGEATLNGDTIWWRFEVPSDLAPEEELFLNKVLELGERLTRGRSYDLIQSGALLRHLLLDQRPLVTIVNRRHQVALRFETVNFSKKPPVDFDHHWRSLDPPATGRGVEIRNISKLLKVPIYTSRSVTATVRDVISACANAKGGVHLGSARGEEEEGLLSWDRLTRSFGTEPTPAAIAGIAKVVLKGLRPLVAAILAANRPNP